MKKIKIFRAHGEMFYISQQKTTNLDLIEKFQSKSKI